MVLVKRLQWICAFGLVGASLQAKDLPAYNVGDKVPQDITASVPFNVVDAQATAALKGSQSMAIAAIYHQFTGATNVLATNFLKAFAKAHADFSTALTSTYHEVAIDNPTIESSDFGYFVTAYNVEHKKFPVDTELAITWAHGDSGDALRDKWLASLLQAMNHPIQPDAVPPHFIYRKKIRIMPVTNINEKFTFQTAWRRGVVVSADNVPTLSSVRTKFRHGFSEDEQPIAAALAQFLQADCIPDGAMTKDARDFSVRQIVVSDHFDAGQLIVRGGDTINAQEKAELDAMALALVPGTLNQKIAAEQERAQQAQQQAQQEHDLAQMAQQQAQTEHDAVKLALQQQQQAQQAREQAENQAQQERTQADTMREQALNAQTLAQNIRRRDDWFFTVLVGISVLALLVLWRLLRQRGAASVSALVPAPVKLQRLEKERAASQAELAPYLAQTLKDAVVQGLAAQRAELLEAQRQASTELNELVQRLDLLQAPMQERMRAYQERIQELQKELAERTEENRELLRLKIEMMRRQLENERGRVKLN